MKISVLAAAVAAITTGSPGLAQNLNENLETVLVRAARTPVPASELGSSVSVLDRELLQQRQMAPLGEILRSVPGVAVSRGGVLGSQTQLRLRGAEANQVLVFIDGIRANDSASGGEFNMAHVLNYGIESVEVIRGPQSALWGSDALAGVINITSRKPQAGFAGDVFAEGGSNSWQNYGGSARYADDRLQAAFSAQSVETDGENISRQGGEDDGYENQSMNLSLGYKFSDNFRVDSQLRYTDAENEFDGTDFFVTGLPQDSANVTDAEQTYGRIAAGLNTLDDRWTHQLSYSLTETENENQSENEFAASGFDITNADAELTVISYQSSFKLGAGHIVTGALERQQEDYKQRGPVDFGDPNRDEDMTTDSAIFEYRGQLTEAISILASARYDDNSDFEDKTTGRLSAAWRINEGQTKLRAAYGTGIKNPTFTERFGYFNDFIGNPDLEPEESTGWELGMDQRLLAGRLRLSLTWFHEELDDEINGFVFDPSLGASTAANEDGSSERDGLEFSGSWLVMENLSLNFAYTWLDATEEDGAGQANDEIRRAEHIANANLNWTFLNNKANLNLNVDYNGEQDDLFFPATPPYLAETVELKDFTLVALSGVYNVTDALQVFARVENALDEDYEEIYGYVSPGRTASVGMRYNFGR